MGIYFNPGNEGFRKAAKSEIYIDKTGLINVTNFLMKKKTAFQSAMPAVSENRRRQKCLKHITAADVIQMDCFRSLKYQKLKTLKLI